MINYHPHDKKWIEGQLSMIPAKNKQRIIDAYSNRFAEIERENKGEINAKSLARRECNTRLRLCVDKVLES